MLKKKGICQGNRHIINGTEWESIPGPAGAMVTTTGLLPGFGTRQFTGTRLIAVYAIRATRL